MLPSESFRRNVVLCFPDDAIGIRCATSSWGSGHPHREATFPQSRQTMAEILACVRDDEQAKPAPDHDPGIAGGNTTRVKHFNVARLTARLEDMKD